MLAKLFLFIGALGAGACLASAAAVPFTVVVYNIENLHDADGVAVYDDYQPDHYTPRHLSTKLTNTASLMKRFRGGEGPDIILFNEIEIDQTPNSGVEDVAAFVERWRGQSVAQLLDTDALPAELAGVPAEVWLFKALHDAGLRGYQMAVGDDQPSPPTAERRKAIKNVTFSRFPITGVRQHQVEQARIMLETEIDVAGQRLFVFNNHWKSGASDPVQEQVRIGNARVLQGRLKEIFKADPTADVIVGGDLNSSYNQKARNPRMNRTAVDDIMRIGYSEPALRRGEIPLYNLWYELEPARRGSDVFRGEWGTLMHLIISRGLHDFAGVQYQDNSFGVARLPGQNADFADAPIRWNSGGRGGSGFSDHLPIYAHFNAVSDDSPDRLINLQDPSNTPPSGEVFRVNYAAVDLDQALEPDALPAGVDLRDGSWTGKLFKVNGSAISGRYPKVRFMGQSYDVYSPRSEVRDALAAQATRDRRLRFYGMLGIFRGNWQFVVQDIKWMQK